MSVRGGALDGGSCPHAHIDTAQVSRIASSRLNQGQEWAIHLARVYGERRRNFVGHSFWARDYFVSTVGRDETAIREYIRHQEAEERRLDQTDLWR